MKYDCVAKSGFDQDIALELVDICSNSSNARSLIYLQICPPGGQKISQQYTATKDKLKAFMNEKLDSFDELYNNVAEQFI